MNEVSCRFGIDDDLVHKKSSSCVSYFTQRLQLSSIQFLSYGDAAMTILDDLFNLAEENWNSIQGTADTTQQVVVYAAMAQVWASDLKASNTFQPLVPPIDRLIYNPPITLKSPASFVGSLLTITAPNFHIFPVHPNYGIQWQGNASTAATDDGTGVVYFHVNAGGWGNVQAFVAVTLYNLRLEAF
jgi:hypothetical protein